MELKELKTQFLSQYTLSSEKTKERLNNEIDLFFKICGIKSIEDLNKFNNYNVDLFYQYAKENGWTASTTNLRLQSAKLIVSWAFSKKLITNNYLDDIKRIRMVNSIHYTPPKDDCFKLLEYINNHTKKKRLYLMTKLLIFTGLRRSEICNLKTSDLNKANFTIRVLGKGKKIVEQPVPQDLFVELVEYVGAERKEVMSQYKKLGGKDQDYLFVSGIGEKCNANTKDLKNGNKVNDNVFYQQLKRFSKNAGLENAYLISPHALRRFAGTEIYNQTGDIKTASEFLRHSNIATTEQCYINYNKEKLINAVNSVYEENTKQDNKLTQDDEYQLFLLLKKKYGKV